MSPNSLIEYRCNCGKLLFRGFLLFSVVEVKCNRCNMVHVFKSKGKNNEPVSFSFFVDSLENVAGGCCATSLIGLPQRRFIGRHVENLFSHFRKTSNLDFFVLPEYLSQNNKFSTWDEALKSVSRGEKEKASGYHIFGRIHPKIVDES